MMQVKSNNFVTSIVLLLLCAVTLSGCQAAGLFKDGNMIEPTGLFDAKTLIEEGKSRSKDAVKLGPKPKEIETRSVDSGSQTILDKEKTINYVNANQEDSFRVSINVENVEIRSFMNMLSKMIGTNIIVSDEVKGYVTANLKDVPWNTVLETILNIKQLAQHVNKEANLIRIHDQTTIVQLEEFDRKRQSDQQNAAILQKAAEPMVTKTYKLFYTEPEDIKTLLEGVLESQSSSAKSLNVRDTSPQITVDARMNQIIIKARKDDLALAEKLIQTADARTKQVFIEAFIVEASDGFAQALGTRLGMNIQGINELGGGSIIGLGSGSTTAISPGTSDSSLVDLAAVGQTSGISLVGTVDNLVNLKLELTAMESEGLTKVVSNPRIYTLDNQEATIFQGTEVPYETVSADGTQIEFKEAGLRLAVTPTVVGDGNLVMQITVNRDTVDTSIQNPPITKSEINTNLVTQDGEIVVIGGIYTQSRSKSKDSVPLFSDIPLLGRLFTRKAITDDRQELMIFIAPRVL